jgi:hypothetical protein
VPEPQPKSECAEKPQKGVVKLHLLRDDDDFLLVFGFCREKSVDNAP